MSDFKLKESYICFKQFVYEIFIKIMKKKKTLENIIKKIQTHKFIKWLHVKDAKWVWNATT